jgi:hypothetical protein
MTERAGETVSGRESPSISRRAALAGLGGVTAAVLAAAAARPLTALAQDASPAAAPPVPSP